MRENFHIEFNGIGKGNINRYNSKVRSMDVRESPYLSQIETDYGNVEDFDYENYLEDSNGQFDFTSFYEEQEKRAEQYNQLFTETLENAEQEKKELENSYFEAMMIGYDNNMYGLISLDGYRYATLEEYIQSCKNMVDPNACIDPETFAFSEEIYQKRLKEAEQTAKNYYQDIFNSYFKEAMGMTYQEYQTRKEELQNDIAVLKASRYALAQQSKELPYQELATTEEYQRYRESHQHDTTYDNIRNLITKYVEENYPTTYYGGVYDTTATVNTIMNQFRYELLSEEDKMMCLYLYETKGLGYVYKYVSAIEDRLNRVAGEREAKSFIESISTNGKIDVNLWNGAKTSGKGVVDGIENFGEGLFNLFTTESMISSNQYAQMYILEALNNSKILTGTYQFSMSAGNMIPAMTVSALVSALATPGAGSVVGSSLMGLSAGGNAKNQALVNGNSLVESYVYGGCIGLSETTLGYFLGHMPGLSKTSGFTVKNLLLEGVEELSQEWVEAGLQVAILNQDVDWSKVPEQSLEAFVMGFLMAGLFNGIEKTANIVLHNNTYTINVETVLEYMENHKVNPIEAIEQTHHIKIGLETLTDTQLTEFVDTIQNLDSNSYFETVRTIKQNYGVDQGCFSKLKVENPELYTRLREKVIHEYHFYPKDVDKLFTIIDSIGACNYARSVNVLIEEFRAKPKEFENLFGFPLYMLDSNGKVVINGEELLLDLYIWGNINSSDAELFSKNSFGNLVFNDTAYQFVDGAYRRVHQRGGSYNEVIDYLRSKSPSVQLENRKITTSSDSLDVIRSTLMNNAFRNLSMGYGPNANTAIPMLDLSTGSLYPMGGGHWVKITEVKMDGIIVSSWGKKFFIKYEDLMNFGQFEILTDKLIYP